MTLLCYILRAFILSLFNRYLISFSYIQTLDDTALISEVCLAVTGILMILTTERGRVTDHRHKNANDNKQTLIRKVAQLLEHDKAVMSIQTGNVIH
jgi:uncharacterized integral membrane protein